MAVELQQILARFPNLTYEQKMQAQNIFEYSPKSSYRYCQVISKVHFKSEIIRDVEPVVEHSKKPKKTTKTFRKWTPKEEKFLKENWGKLPPEHIAIALQRRYDTVCIKAMRMGIKSAGFKHWKEHEIKYLLENYGVLTVNEIAEKLGRTPQGIRQKAQKLLRSK